MSVPSATQSDADKLLRRNRELSILNTIAAALNREINLAPALQTALMQVAELFNLHTGWIFLRHEATHEFYLAAAQNLPPALADEACLLMEGSCTCLNSYQVGGLDHRDRANVIICSRLEGLLTGTNGLRYHASIPLYAQQKPLGVLNVASEEDHWWLLSPDDLRLLHTVGDLLSIAIERARLFDKSTQLGIVEERNRLAREIHDTLAQGLTAVTLKLETVDALLEMQANPDQIRQTVQQALALTQENLEEARRSVLDLRAAPLEGRNLPEALGRLTQDFAESSGLAVNFEVTGGQRPLPLRVEVGLYRIVQESLNNIAQHAQASHIEVWLLITPNQISLGLEDDGVGFEPSAVPEGRFGLLGLNERVRLLGGQLQLESSPGNGVWVEVTIPLS
jgi:two-component system NarL family sensor kinase